MSSPLAPTHPKTPALRRALPWLFALCTLPAGAFTLGTDSCPMAHCDSRMSDLVNGVAPATARPVRIDRTAPPAFGGLGCVSNGRLAACTGGGDPAVGSNLVVYDGDGNRLWDDGGLLGPTAWKSAPILSADDQLIAADQNRVLRVDLATGTVLWQTPKPDDASPISPVPAGSNQDMVLLASGAGSAVSTPLVSVFDIDTGALLDSLALIDPVSGLVYATYNTPSVQGNRAYVLASAMDNEASGRLFALDMCTAAACGGRGKLSVAWTFDFRGPSGASPLLVGSRLFFDGRAASGAGTFMAVDDTGAAPALVWQTTATSRFAASAAQDPRGGFWIYPWQSGKLLRVHPGTGALIQTVDVSTVLGAGAGYYPVSAVSVSTTAGGAVVLTFGARTAGNSTATPPFVAAINVSSSAGGTLLWKRKFARSAAINVPTGQFPILTGSSGGHRIVVRGTNRGTYFIGER